MNSNVRKDITEALLARPRTRALGYAQESSDTIALRELAMMDRSAQTWTFAQSVRFVMDPLEIHPDNYVQADVSPIPLEARTAPAMAFAKRDITAQPAVTSKCLALLVAYVRLGLRLRMHVLLEPSIKVPTTPSAMEFAVVDPGAAQDLHHQLLRLVHLVIIVLQEYLTILCILAGKDMLAPMGQQDLCWNVTSDIIVLREPQQQTHSHVPKEPLEVFLN